MKRLAKLKKATHLRQLENDSVYTRLFTMVGLITETLLICFSLMVCLV